jgi:hypothetical protein
MTTASPSGARRYTAIVESSIESLEDPRVEGRTTGLEHQKRVNRWESDAITVGNNGADKLGG